MAWQAENERQAAVQRDLRGGARTYAKWLAMAENEPGILHKITKPPVRREEEIATPSGVICCPTEIVDLKAETFKDTWTDPGNPHGRHCQNLGCLRRVARQEDPQAWAISGLDIALKGEPDKGQGVDKVSCSDIRRLPGEGRQAIVD
eukprot:1273142-Pyramimonas_sp.AAC.1